MKTNEEFLLQIGRDSFGEHSLTYPAPMREDVGGFIFEVPTIGTEVELPASNRQVHRQRWFVQPWWMAKVDNLVKEGENVWQPTHLVR